MLFWVLLAYLVSIELRLHMQTRAMIRLIEAVEELAKLVP